MDAKRWLQTYARAWVQADPELVLGLFTPDATYRSQISATPHRGHAGIAAYWTRATSTQSNVEVRLGEPLVDGNRVAAEWWTTGRDREDDADFTLPGCLLLEIAGDGRCHRLWEYWHVEHGSTEPPAGWGRLRPGNTSATRAHAQAWASSYEAAWRRLDAESIPPLYSHGVVYRSHPLRPPDHGRDGVLRYTTQAYAAERHPDPRFSVTLAAGASAAVEYWATLVEEGEDSTLAGCDILLFEDGLVAEQREYWHLCPGFRSPPHWGR